MIGRLRQLSEPWLRQQVEIEKSQTPVERYILVQWVRKSRLVQTRLVALGTVEVRDPVYFRAQYVKGRAHPSPLLSLSFPSLIRNKPPFTAGATEKSFFFIKPRFECTHDLPATLCTITEAL